MPSNLKEYAKYLADKYQGDISFAKQVVFNNAVLASDEGNIERVKDEAEVFHHLKVIEGKKAS